MSTITDKQREQLGTAFNQFIKGLRLYVYQKMVELVGEERWEDSFVEGLYESQIELWNSDRKNGIDAVDAIDFGHLKPFSMNYRDILRKDFGRKTNSLPTYFGDIADVRNKWAHHSPIEQEEAEQAFNLMMSITKTIGMSDLSSAIKQLKESKTERKATKLKPASVEVADSSLVPWFRNVKPHRDIQMGILDESVFAANLAQVALGNAREIYLNRDKFFQKTYFTAGLVSLTKRVIQGLSQEVEAENRVISLETGFGGGKTHSLISVYHLVNWGREANKSPYVKELLSKTGQIEFKSASVAVFTNTTNDPTQGRGVDGLNIKTLWGELAFQLGGKEAYEIIRANDENRTAPKGLFNKVLEKCKPSLMLIDELADYCVSASGVPVGSTTLADQTISFIQELSEAVSLVQNSVLVATLPASVGEVASSQQGAQILTSLRNRLTRVSADTKPVADEEIFEVIRRRLFEDLGDTKAINGAVSNYMKFYEGMVFNHEMPSEASKLEYKKKLEQSYPFHPELIDMFRIRWASNHDFQRTRGVLRILASIVSDLWKRQTSLVGSHGFIHTSDVNFGNLDTLTSQLKKLYGNGYDAVITADIAGTSSNAFKIDHSKGEFGAYDIAQGVAATILMGSFGTDGANKGIAIDELKLCVLKPDTYNHAFINTVLDELESSAHYLYYGTSSGGSQNKRYWFHTKPNVNILINSAKNEIKKADINAEILGRLEAAKGRVNNFNLLVNPSDDIPEQKHPTLLILGTEFLASLDGVSSASKRKIEKIATKKGESNRIYRNTMLFLLCTEMGYSKLESDVSEYLSCIKIRDEYSTQLERDQKEDVRRRIEQSTKLIDSSIVSAFSVVAKHMAKSGIDVLPLKQFKDSISSQLNLTLIDALKDEEWYLDSVGLGLLKRNNLLPTTDVHVRTKDVYESFLRFDDKPMVSSQRAVQDSLLRYCQNGEFAIATGEEGHWNNTYFKQDVPMFDVSDETYWLVDKSTYTAEEPAPTSDPPSTGDIPPEETPTVEGEQPDDGGSVRTIKSLTVSGKVPLENYSNLFTSFINPLKENSIEIEVIIKAKSTPAKPLTESSQEYKIVKESAKQLGLGFEED
jgi:hypothetical protein